ncbi:MAG: hypothetical protein U0324_28360 [Polyangiales bacterium]
MKTFHRRPVETLELIPPRGSSPTLRRGRRVRRLRDAIVCAPAPPTLLDGGPLGPTLVTEAVRCWCSTARPSSVRPATTNGRGAPARRAPWRAASGLLGLMVPLAV